MISIAQRERLVTEKEGARNPNTFSPVIPSIISNDRRKSVGKFVRGLLVNYLMGVAVAADLVSGGLDFLDNAGRLLGDPAQDKESGLIPCRANRSRIFSVLRKPAARSCPQSSRRMTA